MSASRAETHQPGGRFRIEQVGTNHREHREAVRLVLSGKTTPVPEVERHISDLQSLARNQGLRTDLVLTARTAEHGRLVTAVMGIESPGRTAMVYTPPGEPSGLQRDALAALLGALRVRAGDRDLVLLQALLPPEDRTKPQLYSAAGFWYLTELIYMDRAVGRLRESNHARLPLTFKSYTDALRPLFLQALDASYEDSLDCPGLNGLRQTEDVLAGHAATGCYDPSGWILAMSGAAPVGVLLTARVPKRQTLEIVYMGVARRARGAGVGGSLLGRALSHALQRGLNDLTLAVDGTNAPALSLYGRWGFEEKARRRAWISTPP